MVAATRSWPTGQETVDDDDDTPPEEKYAALLEERDRLEAKLLSLGFEFHRMLQHEFTGCAVPECRKYPDWDSTGLPLCRLHLMLAAIDYRYSPHDLDEDDEQAPQIMAFQARRNAEREALKPKQTPAVYYIRMNDKIKIGTTTNLKQRMAAFCARPRDLLAIEPGGREREIERHKEFAELRVLRTELFEPSPDLLVHIEIVRMTFGDPARFLDVMLS